jgi:endoglucanase
MRRFLAILALGLAPAIAPAADIREATKALGPGINMGNALEAPNEGDWGMTLQPEYFRAAKEAGFSHVRIPIKWSAHASPSAPYTIDPKFFERIDWAIDQALKNDLIAVVNIHHFDGLDADPEAYEPMAEALWAQIAERYKDRPGAVYFELSNEPHGQLTTERWNAMVPRLLAVVRRTNPDRPVIVGPGMWNGFRELPKLVLPEADRNLIVTFHYYEPFHFTHQGAEWAGPEAQKWLGETWTGTPEQLKELRDAFDSVASWAKAHDRPVYLGEYGAYSKAPQDSRVAWTKAVSDEADARGFARAYWEFGSGFGAYDRDRHAWRDDLLGALLGRRR